MRNLKDDEFKRLSRAETRLTETVLSKWYTELGTQTQSPVGATFCKLTDIFRGFQRDMEALQAVDDLMFGMEGEQDEAEGED